MANSRTSILKIVIILQRHFKHIFIHHHFVNKFDHELYKICLNNSINYHNILLLTHKSRITFNITFLTPLQDASSTLTLINILILKVNICIDFQNHIYTKRSIIRNTSHPFWDKHLFHILKSRIDS